MTLPIVELADVAPRTAYGFDLTRQIASLYYVLQYRLTDHPGNYWRAIAMFDLPDHAEVFVDGMTARYPDLRDGGEFRLVCLDE